MGIKRKKGINQKSKKPLLINDLKLLINVLHENNQNNIKKLRDKTIMLLGFSGGFRRNELVQIEYEERKRIYNKSQFNEISWCKKL